MITVAESSQIRDDLLAIGSFQIGPEAQEGSGQDYAAELAQRHGLNVVRLAKVQNEPGIKTYRPLTDDDVEKLANAKYMIGHEDVGSAGTSPYGALYMSDEHGLAPLREKTIGLNFLWARGQLRRLQTTPIPTRRIVRELIPNMITKQDDFYQRFGHLAVQL